MKRKESAARKRGNDRATDAKLLGYKKTLVFNQVNEQVFEIDQLFHHILCFGRGCRIYFPFIGGFDCRPRLNIYSHFFDLSLLYDPIYRLEG